MLPNANWEPNEVPSTQSWKLRTARLARTAPAWSGKGTTRQSSNVHAADCTITSLAARPIRCAHCANGPFTVIGDCTNTVPDVSARMVTPTLTVNPE